jgi:dihydroorotate dehydrogenase electron transfer subunit
LKQVSAELMVNPRQVLGGLFRTRGRNILGSWIIWLRCPEIAREARPGQFVMVRCGEECILPRPFSIHQIDDKGGMALFFSAWEDGKGTNWLSRRQKGDRVDLLGPLGNGYAIYPASRNLLLVAGGIGIAPLRFLADQALGQEFSVKLLLGASGEFKASGEPNSPQLYPRALLPSGLDLKTITSSSDGLTGMVTELLSEHTDWADQVFACGPLPMYRDMALKKTEFKLDGKPVQVSLEMRMGCGLGVCYGCTVKTRDGLKQVCQDGPVFDLDDILWDELAYDY